MKDARANYRAARDENLASDAALMSHLSLAFGFLLGADLPGCASALAILWDRDRLGPAPGLAGELQRDGRDGG